MTKSFEVLLFRAHIHYRSSIAKGFSMNAADQLISERLLRYPAGQLLRENIALQVTELPGYSGTHSSIYIL